jgi:predicted nucleotidyltransferase
VATESDLAEFLDDVVRWARSVEAVRAVALVGSWARGEAREDSDIDVIVLSRSPDALVEDTSWIGCAGLPSTVGIEDWGAIRSVRVHYELTFEVEYGVGPLEWAALSPVDEGTRRVVSDGLRVVYDPDQALARLDALIRA